jgi:hypothetical protein
VIILNSVITEVRCVMPRPNYRDSAFTLITDDLKAGHIAVIKKVSMIADDRQGLRRTGSVTNVVGPKPGASTLSSQERVGGNDGRLGF